MVDRKLMKETIGIYSEVSLLHIVSACKAILKEGIPNDLEGIMGHVKDLQQMGELISRTLDAIYAIQEIEEDLSDWEVGDL